MICARSHRQERAASSASSSASMWKYCDRSGSVVRSHRANTACQTFRSGMPFGAVFSPGFALAAWIRSRNQAGYSYRS